MTNNTIVNNHSNWRGGGLYLRLTDGVSSDVSNNIIYNNSSPSGADIYLWNDIGAGINLYNNDFNQTQPSGIYIQNPSTVNSGDNLNNVDPLFVDAPNDDYHLTLGSPCRNAGTEPDFGLPPTDFEGDSRICGLAPDIGADEVDCFDSDGDGIPDGEDDCPTSDLSGTVMIDGCDSGVSNTLFPEGCTISDEIAKLASDPANHGKFVSAVAHYTNDLKKDGVITGEAKEAIQSCAGESGIP